MKTVTLNVSSRAEINKRFTQAMKGKAQQEYISFATPQLLFKLLTANRWELLRHMQGAEPMALREVARKIGRDVKAVHNDVHALLAIGILQKTDDGKIVFPFDKVHVDFMLSAAAA